MTAETSLAAALAALQAQLPHVTKDAVNPHFQSRYATLDAITAALFPVMAGLGLSFTCAPGWHAQADGSPNRFALRYTLMHAPTGEREVGLYPLPEPGNPQQIGSAITYARRYALCAVTGLAPDDDDDGNAASGPAPRPSRQTAAQQKAARTPDPARGKTPTEQRDTRARRVAEEKAVAQARAQDRPMDRGPLPDADNTWQDATPEDRPGTASPGQKRAIEALLTKLGCPTGTAQHVRDERHGAVLKYLPALEALASMHHLSFNEAATVIRGLSADTGDEKMPQTVPDHAQRAANDYPADWPA